MFINTCCRILLLLSKHSSSGCLYDNNTINMQINAKTWYKPLDVTFGLFIFSAKQWKNKVQHWAVSSYIFVLLLYTDCITLMWFWPCIVDVLCVRFAGCCPQTGHITLNSTLYRQLENQAPNTTGSNHSYNTLELLMMGIMVPETCWASNKICNKKFICCI
jgi:hypothetical protein